MQQQDEEWLFEGRKRLATIFRVQTTFLWDEHGRSDFASGSCLEHTETHITSTSNVFFTSSSGVSWVYFFSWLTFVKDLEKYTWPSSLKGAKELLPVHMQEQGVWLLLSGSEEPHLPLAVGVWWGGSPTLQVHAQGGDTMFGVFLHKSAADLIVYFCWNQQFQRPFSDAQAGPCVPCSCINYHIISATFFRSLQP